MDATATPVRRTREIDLRAWEGAVHDLEGIGHILLDLATIVEDGEELNWRSLYFLGKQIIAIGEQIDQAARVDEKEAA